MQQHESSTKPIHQIASTNDANSAIDAAEVVVRSEVSRFFQRWMCFVPSLCSMDACCTGLDKYGAGTFADLPPLPATQSSSSVVSMRNLGGLWLLFILNRALHPLVIDFSKVPTPPVELPVAGDTGESFQVPSQIRVAHESHVVKVLRSFDQQLTPSLEKSAMRLQANRQRKDFTMTGVSFR